MTNPGPVQYKDPIITKYIELIKANCDAFKAFYYGDPIVVPVSNLPALVITKVDTGMTEFSNAEDEHTMQLTFNVITDIRDSITDDTAMAPGTNALYYLIEGRDPSTLQLLPNSLAYILRHNVDLFQGSKLYTDVGSKTRISYALTVGKRAQGQYGIEGSITIVAKLIQLR